MQLQLKKNCALPECFSPFVPKRPNQRYCTPECTKKARKIKNNRYYKQQQTDFHYTEYRAASEVKKEKDEKLRQACLAEIQELQKTEWEKAIEEMKEKEKQKSRLLISTPRMEQQ